MRLNILEVYLYSKLYEILERGRKMSLQIVQTIRGPNWLFELAFSFSFVALRELLMYHFLLLLIYLCEYYC